MCFLKKIDQIIIFLSLKQKVIIIFMKYRVQHVIPGQLIALEKIDEKGFRIQRLQVSGLRLLAAAEGYCRWYLADLNIPQSFVSVLCLPAMVLPRRSPQYPVQPPLPPKPGKSFEMTRRCGERSGPEYHICIGYVRFQSEQRSFCCQD